MSAIDASRSAATLEAICGPGLRCGSIRLDDQVGAQPIDRFHTIRLRYDPGFGVRQKPLYDWPRQAPEFCEQALLDPIERFAVADCGVPAQIGDLDCDPLTALTG